MSHRPFVLVIHAKKRKFSFEFWRPACLCGWRADRPWSRLGPAKKSAARHAGMVSL